MTQRIVDVMFHVSPLREGDPEGQFVLVTEDGQLWEQHLVIENGTATLVIEPFFASEKVMDFVHERLRRL